MVRAQSSNKKRRILWLVRNSRKFESKKFALKELTCTQYTKTEWFAKHPQHFQNKTPCGLKCGGTILSWKQTENEKEPTRTLLSTYF